MSPPLFSGDPATIERSIDRTRDRLDRTLDALQTKMSPGQLVDRGIAYMKRNGGEFADHFGQQLKQNPVPMLLTAVGVAWLITASRFPPSPSSRRTGELAGRAAESARGMAERIGAGASDAAHSVGRAAQATRAQGRRAGEALSRAVDEQPLLAGILGLAAGALVGALLPTTETEDRLMGGARDEAVAQARQTGAEALASARSAAQEAATAPPDTGDGRYGESASLRTH